MSKKIYLKVTKIQYSGDSIGDDIRIAGKVFGTPFTFDQKIKRGQTLFLDTEVGSMKPDQLSFTTPLVLQVIERDPVFNDVGSITKDVTIDVQRNTISPAIFRIEVRESRGFVRRRKALFEITCAVRVSEPTGNRFRNKNIAWWEHWRELTSYTYKGINGKEDYNRYDAFIRKVVARWNKEFCDDAFPPTDPLDPNLVKAMVFQESRIGYDSRAAIDVMQVGDTKDPALKTLRGKLKEYWIHKGKLQLLLYDAKVSTVEDSIHWGTRWLYHKAQENNISNNTRTWRSWHHAVKRYGPGTDAYVQSVWRIYKEGDKKEKSQTMTLWSLNLFMLLFGVAIFFQPPHPLLLETMIRKEMNPEARIFKEDIEAKYWHDRSLFFTIIAREKDWWEDIRVGRNRGGSIQWVTIDKEPAESSILKARFLTVRGFSNPILEVYGQTHMGNGALYLYGVGATEVKLLLTVPAAVDSYFDDATRPEHYERYGYSHCGEVIRGEALESRYADINNDGVDDHALHGVIDMLCENNGSTQRVRVDSFERDDYFVL